MNGEEEAKLMFFERSILLRQSGSTRIPPQIPHSTQHHPQKHHQIYSKIYKPYYIGYNKFATVLFGSNNPV